MNSEKSRTMKQWLLETGCLKEMLRFGILPNHFLILFLANIHRKLIKKFGFNDVFFWDIQLFCRTIWLVPIKCLIKSILILLFSYARARDVLLHFHAKCIILDGISLVRNTIENDDRKNVSHDGFRAL